ncbi:hypothetical protein BDV19DRAFT_337767 [Aspergillus venezuelensis]
MLFAKSTVLFALFALGKVVAAAGTGTPACLLTVVGPEDPSNLKGLCKTNAKEIQTSIRDECGDDAKDALSYYSSVCKDGGFEVDTSSSTSTSTHSSSKTSDGSESTSTHSGSATTSGGASSTADANSDSDSDSDSSSGSGSGSSGSDSDSASASTSTDGPTPTNGATSDKQVSAAAFAAVVFVGFAATL